MSIEASTAALDPFCQEILPPPEMRTGPLGSRLNGSFEDENGRLTAGRSRWRFRVIVGTRKMKFALLFRTGEFRPGRKSFVIFQGFFG
jgi:hypothetical protein